MFDKEKRLKNQLDKLVGEYDKHFEKARAAKAKNPADAKIHEMRMEGVDLLIKKVKAKLKEEIQKKAEKAKKRSK